MYETLLQLSTYYLYRLKTNGDYKNWLKPLEDEIINIGHCVVKL